jgi:hypothetical protein
MIWVHAVAYKLKRQHWHTLQQKNYSHATVLLALTEEVLIHTAQFLCSLRSCLSSNYYVLVQQQYLVTSSRNITLVVLVSSESDSIN